MVSAFASMTRPSGSLVVTGTQRSDVITALGLAGRGLAVPEVSELQPNASITQ